MHDTDDTAAPAAACSHLYLWDTRLAYAARGYVSREHAHFAATLIVALRRHLRIAVEHDPASSCSAALIGPNRRFAIDAPDTNLIIFNQDPDAHGYAAMASRLDGAACRVLPAAVFDPVRDELTAMMTGALSCAEAGAAFERVLAILDPRAQDLAVPAAPLDPRVHAVVRTLREERPASICVPDLAGSVDTSSDRLMRLFTGQLGIPIRHFALWLKLRSAMSLLQRGRNLTWIAQDAGFYDSAHLVRTATEMYGVRLGGFNDTRFVQVHHCAPCQADMATTPCPEALNVARAVDRQWREP